MARPVPELLSAGLWIRAALAEIIVLPNLSAMLALGLSFGVAVADAATASELKQTKAFCQAFRVDAGKINDYRSRNSTPFQEWSYWDNWGAHTLPAIERIRAGEVSHRVMADLNFTLTGWPNHVPALKALVDYAVAGGKSYEFPPIECFFAHAQRFFPDDAAVYALEGFYYTKSRQFKLGEQAYLAALAVDNDSIEVHYYLGLMYFEIADFESALKHAHAAYGGGYPLPGLRKKLKQVGHWREPEAMRAQED